MLGGRRLWGAVLVVAAGLLPAAGWGEEWQARARLLGLDPTKYSRPVATTGSRIVAETAVGGELTLARRFTGLLWVELGAAAASFDLASEGGSLPGLDVGSMQVFLPSLTMQFRSDTTTKIRPYGGVGVTFGMFSGYELSADMEQLGIADIEFNDAARVSLQVGADVAIGKGWLANLDLRYIPLSTQATLRQTTGGTLDSVAFNIHPLVLGVGIGRSF